METFDFSIPDLTNIKKKYNDPNNYLLSKELKHAVKVAMHLGQPLFLTGEPGTGKTQLAYKIAYDFQLSDEKGAFRPFIFNTKTSSTAQDLFYTYDAVRHFQDANIKGGTPKETNEYIQLQALGRAIALTDPEEAKKLGIQIDKPRNSVVLIDEIDKAPTDFPNDILYEIEHMAFEIKELNLRVKGGTQFRPIVLMTSNSEKNLPEAFLRRCVFYHIPFPDKAMLKRIITTHMGEKSAYTDDAFVKHFMDVREVARKKKPATAELIGWLRMLEMENFVNGSINFKDLSDGQKELLKFSYSILAKNKEDLAILEKEFCA